MSQYPPPFLATEEPDDDQHQSFAGKAHQAIHDQMEAQEVRPFVNPLTPFKSQKFFNPLVDKSLAVSDPPPALEGEVIDAQPPSSRKVVTSIAVLEEEAGPPTPAFIAARDSEAKLIADAKAIIPTRKGNRRPRRLKADKHGNPVRNLPAVDDPIILRRRSIAMPLWNRGLGQGDVREQVNAWLMTQALAPVSAETIRKDKEAIFSDWERDYDQSSPKNRAQHISALNRMKAEAWASYEFYSTQVKGATAASQFLKICVSIEAELAILDGSKKRAEVAAVTEAGQDGQNRITRVYLGVNISDLDDNPMKQLEVPE